MKKDRRIEKVTVNYLFDYHNGVRYFRCPFCGIYKIDDRGNYLCWECEDGALRPNNKATFILHMLIYRLKFIVLRSRYRFIYRIYNFIVQKILIKFDGNLWRYA